MTDLQRRARAFLEQPIPTELAHHYAPDSLTDRLLANFADQGSLDDEGYELALLCASEVEDARDRHETEQAKQYFQACGEILNGIIAEGRPNIRCTRPGRTSRVQARKVIRRPGG